MKSGAECFVIAVLVGIACFCIGFVVGSNRTESRLRSEAVNHNAAEFYLDANHVRQWRWLDAKE